MRLWMAVQLCADFDFVGLTQGRVDRRGKVGVKEKRR